MDHLFWAVEIFGTLCTLLALSYLKGRSKRRAELDQTYIDETPYWAFQLLAWLWLPMIAIVGFSKLQESVGNLGAERGLAIDTERKELRQLARNVGEIERNTLKAITDGKESEPLLNLSVETQRALTTRSIEAAMADESAQRAERRRQSLEYLQRKAAVMREAGFLEPDDDPFPLPEITLGSGA